jgi:hypothetical protein
MNLKEILEGIIENSEPILLSDDHTDWEARDLLQKLSERVLRISAYYQPGLYIAEINDAGYLGRVLYRVKQKK